MDIRERIEELKTEIARLEGALPKHSPSAAMLYRLEELEDELADLEKAHPEIAIGLEPGKVELFPYTELWATLFQDEKRKLAAALGDQILDIYHVGSTSVPGLCAKPIIDIGATVEDFETARDMIPVIEELGYNFRGELGIPGRHYFNKSIPRTHHLHIFEPDNPAWKKITGFRDYLIAHPKEAQAYGDLKTRLAEQHPDDRVAYLEGKTEFVLGILKKAGIEGE